RHNVPQQDSRQNLTLHTRKALISLKSALPNRAQIHREVSKLGILGLASAYSLLGQFKQADVYFARYKKANGNNATYLNDYGFSMMLRGNLTQAEKLLQRASSEQPGSLTIQNNLAALRRLKANPTGFVGHRPKRGTSSF
ncbi:hypothetical protein AAFO90_25075, partial [Phaeobacter sp. CAU 1743]